MQAPTQAVTDARSASVDTRNDYVPVQKLVAEIKELLSNISRELIVLWFLEFRVVDVVNALTESDCVLVWV